MKKILVAIVIVLLVVFGLFGIRFGSALFQEDNTVVVIWSILQLERTNEVFIQVTDSPETTTYVSLNEHGNQLEIVNNYMDELGWEYVEQMGSAFLF